MSIDWNALPDERNFRFVALLNKKIEPGRLMNALGHMTAGLAGKVGKSQDMAFLEYKDKDGGSHPGISHFPFIVLAADNSNQIRTVRKEAISRGIPYTDFTSTMTGRQKSRLMPLQLLVRLILSTTALYYLVRPPLFANLPANSRYPLRLDR